MKGNNMSLLDMLYETADQVGGLVMAGVIGTDGLGVEMIMDESISPHSYETADLELAWLVAQVSRAADNLAVGSMRGMVLETDSMTYVLSQVLPNYYVVMGVDPEANVERARFAVWQMVERIRHEL